MTRTLVLGIGNTLLADEGVGVRSVEAMRLQCHDFVDIEYLDGGTLSFTLAVPVGECDELLVIDAANLSATPGTVRLFAGEEMDRYLRRGGLRSVHEVGLTDLLDMVRLADGLPQRRALIGIQPDLVDWGEPSAAVAAAIPEACRQACEVIEAWRR